MRFRRKSQAPQRVIDLRDESAEVVWGSPVPCPECAGRGYLDHIDPFKEIMYLHCTACGSKYEVTKAPVDSDHAVGA